MTYSVFLDIGFGFVKALDSNNKTILLPSLYSEIPSVSLNGNETGIECEYGSFLFGDSASNISSMTRRFQSYEDCLTDAYAASCLLAISELNGGNVVDVTLCLSLPFDGRYLQQELMDRLQGTHIIKRLGYHKQTINISFPPKYGVMLQNIAPVFASLDLKKVNKTGEVWFANGNIGSKTFEQATFGINLDTMAIMPGTLAQQATEQKGAFTLANNIEPLLKERFRGQLTEFSQHEIFKIIISGKVEVGNEEVDVSSLIEPKKQEYLNTILNYCKNLWSAQNGREILRMYQLTISGGGAHIVAPYLQSIKFHNNIVVSDRPQFDVCVGARNWHKLIGD